MLCFAEIQSGQPVSFGHSLAQAPRTNREPANEWMVWKMMLSHEEGYRALRTLTDHHQLIAASPRTSLTSGTQIFRSDTTDLSTSSTFQLQSTKKT